MENYVKELIEKMEISGIMRSKKMTSTERITGLLEFEKMITQLTFGEQAAEGKRLTDVIELFRERAEKKGVTNSSVIHQAIEDMDSIGRAIAISLSGASGEKQVRNQLQYVRRNYISIPNVCLNGENECTELDQVLITSNGILILEVKNYKHDVIITESGLIYGPGQKVYSDKVLGEQMNTKRYLLRKQLEKQLALHGINRELHIETCVVFTNPTIRITDLYKQEPYCFKAKLSHKIDQFHSQYFYSQNQMDKIAESVKEISVQSPSYEIEMDFDNIRKTFAEAMFLLNDDIFPVEEKQNDVTNTEQIECSTNNKIPAWGKACACFAGAMSLSFVFTGLLNILGNRK